jgi:hypothetical protein
MLKNWPTPLLGPRAHYSYGRLSIISGCSALSVSESDQETLFNQPDCCQILFFKMIFSHFKSLIKVVVLDTWMNLGFWIAWFRYQKLKIFSFEYLTWKYRIMLREGFWPEFYTKDSASITILLVVVLKSYSQSHWDARHCQFLNQIRKPFLTNQIATRLCSLKRFFHFESFIKVVVQDAWMNLGFWITWFRYQKLKIYPFEYLTWK